MDAAEVGHSPCSVGNRQQVMVVAGPVTEGSSKTEEEVQTSTVEVVEVA